MVGVVGAGRMGAGIAQVAIEAGHDVVLEDADPDAVERGVAAIRIGLGRRAARLGLDPGNTIDDWVDGRLERLRRATTLDDLVGTDLVIEAAVEDLAVKRSIVAALTRSSPAAIVAPTRALSVAAIALARAGRVASSACTSSTRRRSWRSWRSSPRRRPTRTSPIGPLPA